MFILDDLLLAPLKGMLWTFEKIHRAATEEIEGREARARGDLSELYMKLETGRITEEQFDAREKELLDRLDQARKMRQQIEQR